MSTSYVSWTRSGHLVYTIAFSVNASLSSTTRPIYFPKKYAKKYFRILHISHCHLEASGVPVLFQLFSYEYRCLIRKNILGKNETAGPSMAPGRNPSKSTQVAHLPFRNQASHLKLLLLFCLPPRSFSPLSLSVFFPNLIKIQKDTPHILLLSLSPAILENIKADLHGKEARMNSLASQVYTP